MDPVEPLEQPNLEAFKAFLALRFEDYPAYPKNLCNLPRVRARETDFDIEPSISYRDLDFLHESLDSVADHLMAYRSSPVPILEVGLTDVTVRPGHVAVFTTPKHLSGYLEYARANLFKCLIAETPDRENRETFLIQGQDCRDCQGYAQCLLTGIIDPIED